MKRFNVLDLDVGAKRIETNIGGLYNFGVRYTEILPNAAEIIEFSGTQELKGPLISIARLRAP